MKQTVFITGASSGFGKAAARLFASNGWNVVATMRSPEKEQELTAIPNVLILPLDVMDSDSIQRTIRDGIAHFGSIDALVNNAGYGLVGIFETITQAQVRRQFEINVFGLMNVTKSLLPHFRSRRSGTIINVSSMGGIVTFPTFSVYHATKFAVEGFSESLAFELSTLNIKVKIIEPGSVNTNFGAAAEIVSNSLEEYQQVQSKFLARYNRLGESHKKATATEVAGTIFFAAVDDTTRVRYVVGADAEYYIGERRRQDDQAYVDGMRRLLF
jgi:NAD(P)-dependent dehydrogenase (short-subunit alcohol dehydrogenase family)